MVKVSISSQRINREHVYPFKIDSLRITLPRFCGVPAKVFDLTLIMREGRQIQMDGSLQNN